MGIINSFPDFQRVAMIHLILLILLVGIAYLVANEGPLTAAITFVSVLFSGLLAMNFFEPLAVILSTNVLATYEWQHRWDIIALLGIFAGSVTLMRLAGDKLFPTYAQVSTIFYHPARWALALATGYTTIAILLTALHVAPLPREFLGFSPEGNNFLGVAPDRQWLALTQYVSEHSLQRRKVDGSVAIFDGAQFPAIPTDLSTVRIWSSFPIRYAARREQYTTGRIKVDLPGAASPAQPGDTPPPARTPGRGF